MIHYSSPPTKQQLTTRNVYVCVTKQDNDDFKALSPKTICGGLTVPGTQGQLRAPSVHSAFNACKVLNGARNIAAIIEPCKDFYGTGVRILRAKSSKKYKVDRTDEEFMYGKKRVNFIQARWSILLPLYECYILEYAPNACRNLYQLVESVAPYKVYVHDQRGYTADIYNPLAPLSPAWMLTRILNRLYDTKELPDAKDDEPAKQPQQ